MAKKDNNSTSIQLTEDEIQMVKNLNLKKEQLTTESNYISQQNIVLRYREKQVDLAYEEIVQYERQILNALTNKYGKGIVDIETGTFIPS